MSYLNTNIYNGMFCTIKCAQVLQLAHEFTTTNIKLNMELINEQIEDGDDTVAYCKLGKAKFITYKAKPLLLKTYKHISRTVDTEQLAKSFTSKKDEFEILASKAAYDDFENNRSKQYNKLKRYLKDIVKKDDIVKDILSTFDQYDPKELYLIYLDRIELDDNGNYYMVICPLWMEPGYEIEVPIQL